MAPYSFNLGSWHIIQLPSAIYRYDCDPAGVLAWLRADLASHRTACTLAFWHEPYWTRTTDEHGRTREVKPWVDLLYGAGVEVVLNGHQHNCKTRVIRSIARGVSGRLSWEAVGSVSIPSPAPWAIPLPARTRPTVR